MQKAAIRGIGEIRKGLKDAGVAEEALKQALKNSDDSTVEAAAITIGSIGGDDNDRGDKLFGAIKGGLKDSLKESKQKSRSCQMEIVKAMGRFSEKSIPCVVHVLEDRRKPNIVRIWAAYVLANIGKVSIEGEPPSVVEPLNAVLRARSSHYRLKEEVKRALTWLLPERLLAGKKW